MIVALPVGFTPDRSEARELLARELARPEYRNTDSPWVQRLWDWLTDVLDRIRVPDLSGLGLGPILLVLLLLGAVVWILLAVGRPRRGERTRAAAVFDSPALSAADHDRLADEAAAAGRFADAVVERFRALTRSLVERDVIPPVPGRTAREVAADAAGQLPEAGEALHRAARIFDDVRYGGHPAGPATDLELRELRTRVGRSRPRLDRLAEPVLDGGEGP
ncbi:DUF4129 domain-containing protein [Kineococcus gynurae]|uniref:DUF4129 domain-containing protein n=1 Tax=Kineococcus gynurae TaxID=452979 RepID=A0ABV5LRA8_9ACTN